MANNLFNTIKSELETDEKVLKSFYSPNIEMVQEGIDKYVTEVSSMKYLFNYEVIKMALKASISMLFALWNNFTYN